jgi:pimeloyl-ACP methyl ester carboxylesterase
VVEAIGDRRDVILVAQSMGAFTAPLVCDRVPTRLIVLVAPMTPAPGESAGDWWANTRQGDAMREQADRDGIDPASLDDPVVLFLHDVPPDVAAESARHVPHQSGTPFEQPWPLDAWPDVPTRFLLCRQDRLFPAPFQRRLARERLGIVPQEMDGGHLPALSRPAELAERLLGYAAGGNTAS